MNTMIQLHHNHRVYSNLDKESPANPSILAYLSLHDEPIIKTVK